MVSGRRWWFAVVLGVGLLSTLWWSFSRTPAPTAAAGALTLRACNIGGIDARCGTLPVFEDRLRRAGRTIDINILVLPATGPNPSRDPVFYLAGGPGQAATELAATGIVDAALRRDRDIVFVDQRGTGQSNPLECELPGSDRNPQGYLQDVFQLPLFEVCRDRLAKRADLHWYSTALAVDDFDEVRGALGYAEVNLIGTSYGTRAVLEYMRRHPSSVRTAVLDGVAPPSLKNPLYHARESQRALELVFEDCMAERACAKAFPKIREEFDEVLRRLDGPSRRRDRVATRIPVAGDRANRSLYVCRDGAHDAVPERVRAPDSDRRA